MGRPWPGRDAATYCCYGCLSLGEQDLQEQRNEPAQFPIDGLTIRIGIGILVAGQSMLFGLGISLEPTTPANVKLAVQSIILLGNLLVMALLGGPLFRTAWLETRQKHLSIESLFCLTLFGAFFASLQSLITGQGAIYFEVISVLLVVYTLGKTIGARSRVSALASTKLWADSIQTARMISEAGQTESVPVKQIKPGDLVEVHPGEMIPVDGRIERGMGFISEATVTGEAFGVVRRPGDRVLASSISQDAVFVIHVTARGTERQIDQLLSIVADARNHPIAIQAEADRLAKIFFPILVVTAILTFFGWAIFKDLDHGLFHAMSVLLVACPCALGLATPIVIWTSLGRLAERGLISRSGDLVEKLAQVDHIILDKTGTLTEDRFRLLDLVTVGDETERHQIQTLLSFIEGHSNHPLATAFQDLPTSSEFELLQLQIIPGQGIEARVQVQSITHQLQIGRPEWIASIATFSSLLEQNLLIHDGHRIDVAMDGEQIAIAMVGERLRDTTDEMLAQLDRLRLPVQVLTGDTTEHALRLNLPSPIGGLLPDQKRQVLLGLRSEGKHVLMLGDGVNDASAMSEAHVAIALATGTDLATHAADATLYHGDLRVIPWAIALGREARRVVRRNLYRAAAYNVLGITLAAAGVLHPILAALLMLVSSLLVAWASSRIGVMADGLDCGDIATDVSADDYHPAPEVGAAVHALAWIAQLVILGKMLEAGGAGWTAIFLLAMLGPLLGWFWLSRPQLSHTLDHTLGMLTLGNLGMVLGWWADLDFDLLYAACCACHCEHGLLASLTGSPWMWVGMFVFGNLAMKFLPRHPHEHGPYTKTAMWIGGNLGMGLGMFGGGWLVGQISWGSASIAGTMNYLGMTIGMISGMLLGDAIFRTALPIAARLRYLPRWLLRQPVGR
jgi:heavy metal translocating P-type ATPase